MKLFSRNSAEDNIYTRDITFWIYCIQVILAVISSVVIAFVMNWTVEPQSAFTRQIVMTTGILGGIALWLKILLNTSLFDYFFINVRPNHVAILGNQLVFDDLPSENERTELTKFKRTSMREVGQGLRGKWPWEVVVTTVNLESEVIIGTVPDGKPLACVTKDGATIFVNYQVTLTPLVGYACMLARRSEDAARKTIQAYFDSECLKIISTYEEKDIRGKLAEIKTAFEQSLGGPKEVHDREREWGLFTGSPFIIEVIRTDRIQQSEESGIITKSIASNVEKIIGGFRSHENTSEPVAKPNPDLVLAAATAAAGIKLEGALILAGNPISSEGLVQTGALKGLTKKEKGS